MVFAAILRASRSAQRRHAQSMVPGEDAAAGRDHRERRRGAFGRPPRARACAGRSSCPADKSIAHRALLVGAMAGGPASATRPRAGGRRALHGRCAARARRVGPRGGRWSPSGRSTAASTGRSRQRSASARLRQLRDDHAPPGRRAGGPAATGHARSATPRFARGRWSGSRRRSAPWALTVDDHRRPRAAAVVGRGRWCQPRTSCRSRAPRCSVQPCSRGLAADGRTTISSPGPTRDHTERMLGRGGRRVRRDGSVTTIAGPGTGSPRVTRRPRRHLVGGAWLVAGAIHPDAKISARRTSASTRPASRFIDVLREMGARVASMPRSGDARAAEPVGDDRRSAAAGPAPVRIDGARVPDLIDELPLLAVAMAAADGPSELRDAGGAARQGVGPDRARGRGPARHRRRRGGAARRLARDARARPARPRSGTHGDHRIAMAFAIAALTGVAGAVTLDDPGCVAVSYPGFWDDLADRRDGTPEPMALRRLRLLTAGESHGPGLSGILDGLPRGLRVSTRRGRPRPGAPPARLRQRPPDAHRAGPGDVDRGAALRAHARLAARLLDRRTATGSNWQERMSVEPIPARGARGRSRSRAPATRTSRAPSSTTRGDIRDVLERASARSTAPRVAAGAVVPPAARGLRRARSGRSSTSSGPSARSTGADEPLVRVPAGLARTRTVGRRRRCAARTPTPRRAMIAEVDAAIEAGDSIGGSFVVVAEGDAHRRRLQRGVGHAPRRGAGRRGHGHPGRQGRRDRPRLRRRRPARQRRSTTRSTRTAPAGSAGPNRAGGIEGGMSNGAPIVVRAAVKPVSTLRKPLDSVDLATGEVRPRAHRAQRRGHPAARGGRGRGDGRARPRRRAPRHLRR